ncbi:hypothetical protein K435DRAFT_858811 [Dendrothele bispora CBS 962.96]|uniref:Uncharacterized protein n=1 Tax=Dendrothele bispora (strain CBS 962.96) TaxID=1314807 RepID=A0A4S8M294_DENBC|nr:hypothetical protein K435DRAFT_858811 [Dendrothele bispora CBS 962.96]
MKLTGSDVSSLLPEGSGRSDGDGQSRGQSPDSNGYDRERDIYRGSRGSFGGGSSTLGKRRKGDEREEGGGEDGSGLSGFGYGSGPALSHGPRFHHSRDGGENKFHLVGNGALTPADMGHRRGSSGGTSTSSAPEMTARLGLV